MPGPPGNTFADKKENMLGLAHYKGVVTTPFQFAVCWAPMSFSGKLLSNKLSINIPSVFYILTFFLFFSMKCKSYLSLAVVLIGMSIIKH